MYQGILLSVASSCLFATLYYYATLLDPLSGYSIFGWRMFLMLPCITLFMLLCGEWKSVTAIFKRIVDKPWLIIGLIASSGLLGSQQWLFMWAPINGRGLNVSLGYFLLPLMMLLVGRVAYGERLSRWQKLSAAVATMGVTHELWVVGGLSWETILVVLGFPAYFVLRRRMQTSNLGGLWFDIFITLPVAAVFIGSKGVSQLTNNPHLYPLLAGLALLSAAAFMSYTVASKKLPLGLFGLLGYVEPVLMVGVSVMLGESIRPEQWLTYIPIWLAVAVLICEGFRRFWRR